MSARRKARVQPLPPTWQVHHRFTRNGRWAEPGTELTVARIRGRVRFIKHVVTPTAEWIDVFDRDCHFRSVRPEDVKVVHWTKKTRANAA